MRKPPEADPLARLIVAARDRGIVDAAQAAALESIAAEIDADAARAEDAAPMPAEARRITTEQRRPFNPVIIAYAAGALLVVFALGWFLAERWRDLGAGGVLAVSVGYAVAFALTAWVLARRGFPVASGLAATLAIAMTPAWTFAILRLTGEWPFLDSSDALARYEPWVATRWIILELATIAVALITLRRVRFFTIALPIAAAFAALLVHIGTALGDPLTAWYVGPFYLCVVGTFTLAIAYIIDRRQDGSEDYALWFYIAGVVVLAVGYMQTWNRIGSWRHALPFIALVLVLAALYLRRRVLLIAAGIAAFGYLAYLAFDVFEGVLALPIVLAGLGLLVIAAAVWAQRRFPKLVARINEGSPASRKTLPGGLISAFGPVVIAVTTMLFAADEAVERTRERDWRMQFYRRRAQRELIERRGADTVQRRDSTRVAPAVPPRR
jgi:hypothetical protein